MDRVHRRSLLRWRAPTARDTDPFRNQAREIADEFGLDIAIVRPRGNDSRQALVDYADRPAVDLILSQLHYHAERYRSRFDPRWIQEDAGCDVMLLGKATLERVSTIMVLGAGSPNDVVQIYTAYRLGYVEDATVRLVHVLDENATEPQHKTIRDYHDRPSQGSNRSHPSRRSAVEVAKVSETRPLTPVE